MKGDATVSQFEECGMNLLPGRNERDAFDEALSEISTDRIEQEPGELSLSGTHKQSLPLVNVASYMQ